MMKNMNTYEPVSLPKKLLHLIDEKKSTHGYTSRADFIKQAVRKELDQLDRNRGKA